jgi:hypothetical protein
MQNREVRTLESLNNTLHLMGSVQGDDRLAKPARRVAEVIQATDILGVLGVDKPESDLPQGQTGDLFAHTGRADAGLLPSTAFVFQALRNDPQNLPETVYQRPGIYAVVHRHAADVVDDRAINSGTLTGGQARPMAMLTHCAHPLTQALVGSHAFSTISQQVHYDIPLSPDRTTREGQVTRGMQHLNFARFATATLGTAEGTGRVAEWVDESITRWKRAFRDQPRDSITPPPEHTELAEAYQQEPLTRNFVEPLFRTVGLYEAAMEDGATLDRVAFKVFEIVEKRVLD